MYRSTKSRRSSGTKRSRPSGTNSGTGRRVTSTQNTRLNNDIEGGIDWPWSKKTVAANIFDGNIVMTSEAFGKLEPVEKQAYAQQRLQAHLTAIGSKVKVEELEGKEPVSMHAHYLDFLVKNLNEAIGLRDRLDREAPNYTENDIERVQSTLAVWIKCLKIVLFCSTCGMRR